MRIWQGYLGSRSLLLRREIEIEGKVLSWIGGVMQLVQTSSEHPTLSTHEHISTCKTGLFAHKGLSSSRSCRAHGPPAAGDQPSRTRSTPRPLPAPGRAGCGPDQASAGRGGVSPALPLRPGPHRARAHSPGPRPVGLPGRPGRGDQPPHGGTALGRHRPGRPPRATSPSPGQPTAGSVTAWTVTSVARRGRLRSAG